MREEKIKKEYAKPTVELIVFNYADVVAASGVSSTWLFGDDDDAISQSAIIPESNVWYEGVETTNTGTSGDPVGDGFSFNEDSGDYPE